MIITIIIVLYSNVGIEKRIILKLSFSEKGNQLLKAKEG